jgi:hypothetical protein
MTVKEFIEKLQTFNPDAKVWISDEQGGGGEANLPWELKREDKFYSGEVAKIGDVMTSYENT